MEKLLKLMKLTHKNIDLLECLERQDNHTRVILTMMEQPNLLIYTYAHVENICGQLLEFLIIGN